jgi:acetyl coenzyme A synthetase (ADP forming)-like protein
MTMSLERVLNATSVAVVGASRAETKRGYQAIRTLLDEKFEGPIYPVNPKESSILGLKCYPQVSDIEGPVDLALITTPAETVPEILEDCGRKGVGGAVVIAGGFGEIGEEGRRLEGRLAEAAGRNKIRIVGPNTSGMINVHSRMNLVGLRRVPRGDIALLSQSGNMALTLITEAAVKSRKGFSYYVGVGNEADVRFHEYLEFFQQDPRTRAILMYVEGMRDGRSFLQQAYHTSREKPIVMLKSGRSATGQRSAGSHTGALAGMSEVARTAFRRAGIIVVENSDELFPVAETLSSLPPIRNNRVAILADGGGHATIAADLLSEGGVEIPPLSEKTRVKLREFLPAAASVRNPVDVAGGADADPEIFARCARVLLHDPQIGGLLIVGLFGGYSIRFAESLAFVEEDAAHQMGKLVAECKKPIVVHSLYNHARPHSLDLLRYYQIPVYDSLEIASRCVGALAEYGTYLHSYQAKTNFVFNWGHKARPRGREIIQKVREEGRSVLLEIEARELIGLHGVPVDAGVLAHTPEEAAALAAGLDGEAALKIVSPQILHKSEAGGVRLGLKTPEEVSKAFSEIVANARRHEPGADIRGVLVTPMAAAGVEVIVGTKIDDQFGPVIIFGIGGITVEVIKDVSFRVLPITPRSAKRMIEDIRSARLLDGFRGRPPADREAIRKLLLSVSEIVESYPEIREMDLNPVIVHRQGLVAVDARIMLKKTGS